MELCTDLPRPDSKNTTTKVGVKCYTSGSLKRPGGLLVGTIRSKSPRHHRIIGRSDWRTRSRKGAY